MARGDKILITGGAGFIGSHLADALAASGNDVVLFDNLEPQVHGLTNGGRPPYLDPAHSLVVGDVCDADALAPLARAADVVVHLAALVGVGQSMYQLRRYTEVNTLGVATLLQILADDRGRVRKLVVASSMSIYGEGAYSCQRCGRAAPRLRSAAQLAARRWEPLCPGCGAALAPEPTDEDKPLQPTSIYAITKRDHEEMVLAFAEAYQLPAVALRFFNVYGSRQALSNPYTGAAAIFSGRILSGQPPIIFEDGGQLRDFVHVSDVVQACALAVDMPAADGWVLNVGTGQARSILEVATTLAERLGWDGGVQVTGAFRAGDVRHCFADLSRIRRLLGYEPRVQFADGMAELIQWVADQQGAELRHADATGALAARGLVR